MVAQAIYDSDIPIISAVGHEPDVTISDYVADLRAATPSNAAELAVPDCAALFQQLDTISAGMETALMRQLKAARKHLEVLSASPALRSPFEYLQQRRKTLLLFKTRLIGAQNAKLHSVRQRMVGYAAKLDAMSPLKVLSRGYAMTQDSRGQLVRSTQQVKVGQDLQIRLSDGTLQATITGKGD